MSRTSRRQFAITAGVAAVNYFLTRCRRADQSTSSAADDKVAPTSQPHIEVTMQPTITPIKQTSLNTCWAAAWTMLLSWSEGRSLSIKEAVARLGTDWLRQFERDEGLDAQTFTETKFLETSKLRPEPPANYIPSYYVDLLASRGPLWINTGNGIMNHATVLTAAQTRRNGRIMFQFADPADGTIVTKTDQQFFADFEREARFIVDRKLDWELRFQIFHW